MKRVMSCFVLALACVSVGCLMLTTQDDRHACNTDQECAADTWCRGVAQIEDAACEDKAEDNETGLPYVKLMDSCFYFYCVDQGAIQCGDELACKVPDEICVIKKEQTGEQDRPWRAKLECAPRASYPVEGPECDEPDLFFECWGDPDRTCAFRTEQMTAERDNKDHSFRCPPE